MRKFAVHFFFWVVFFFMWHRIVYFYVSDKGNRLYFSVLDVSLVIIAFYGIYSYIMPEYLARKRLGRLLVSGILLTALLAVLYNWLMSVFLHQMLVPIHFEFSWNYADLQDNRLIIAALGVFSGCFVKLAVDRLEVGRKMEVMEKEKSKAELIYLKAQLNPHFLFNSLNNLYTQLELDPDEAKGTLIALADLLRYQLYDCNADFIPVAKELAYLENYFNLQSIRKDNCTASILIKGDYKDLMIAPLLLIPFVENAFKYISDDEDGENLIGVKLNFDKGKLHFRCENTFVENQADESTDKGIGLINVKKRLKLIYSDQFELMTTMDNKLYGVTLKLNLK